VTITSIDTATITSTITPSLTATLTHTFSSTATVTDTPVNTPTQTATSGAYLTAQIIVTPSAVNAGDTITVIMTLTNTGNTAADNVMPSGLAISGTGSVSELTSPASMISIPAGASVTFTWTYNADSSGIVTFQGSASGIDAAGSWAVTSGLVTSNALAIGVPLPTITFTATTTYTPTVTDTPANTFTGTPTVSYTATKAFTVTPTQTPAPLDAENFEITDEMVYPNPYNPGLGMPLKITADFSQKHRNMKVKIYTSSLRCIRVFEFLDSPLPGIRTLSVPASRLAGLANGSCFYFITAENEKGARAKSNISNLVILK
jgi:hypothetical protein